MKIIDRSPYPEASGWISVRNRVLGIVKFGLNWYTEANAQSQAMAILARNLDDKFSLVRGLFLPGRETALPLFLVGPPGAQLIYVTPIKGIFRAKGDAWYGVNAHRQFAPAHPNLITETVSQAQAVQATLEKLGYNYPKIEPVLLCTDPGVHVESVRPDARVVLSDAIDVFAAGLKQSQPALSAQEIEEIVQLLLDVHHPAGTLVAINRPPVSSTTGILGRMGADLTPRQRLILVVLALGFLLTLVVLAYMAIHYT